MTAPTKLSALDLACRKLVERMPSAPLGTRDSVMSSQTKEEDYLGSVLIVIHTETEAWTLFLCLSRHSKFHLEKTALKKHQAI